MEDMVMFDALQQHYNGKKVFVTGHTGFKGSWLQALLHRLGAKVKGYSLEPEYESPLYEALKNDISFEEVIGDIRFKSRLSEEMLSFQPDMVFHLAAQPLVRRSYQIPAETFDVNVTGTANLLEAVTKLHGKCTVVVITTDKVYENKESDILYKEDDRLGGYDPYSASKACAELVVSAFRNSFFHPDSYADHRKALASARAGNVIGGGDWSEDRIIPDIVRALRKSSPIQVRNPASVRPWQHVLEPLTGYLLLGMKLDKEPGHYSEAFNFGPYPDDHLKVEELVNIAIECYESGKWINTSNGVQPHESGLLKLDIQKSVDRLDWKPRLSAKEAIGYTIHWYRETVGKNPLPFTFGQINNYFA